MQKFWKIYKQMNKQRKDWKRSSKIKIILCYFNIWTKELKVINSKNKIRSDKTTRKKTNIINCTIRIRNKHFLKIFRTEKKLIFSAFLQIKIEHDFFKFYLHKLFVYESNQCNENCNEIQTFKHLLLNCRHFLNKQNEKKKYKSFYDNTQVLYYN